MIERFAVKPFFSVIIATFNAEKSVIKTLDSLISQIEKPEIIIVDGLSRDDTVLLIKNHRKFGEVKFLSESDQGVFDAWNKGVSLATGEWLIFLGADDFYPDENSLRILRSELEKSPAGLEVAYGGIELVNETGEIISYENEPWEQCGGALPVNMPFTHTGTAHKRSLFDGRSFDVSFRIAGDYQFLYPALSRKNPSYVPGYIVRMGDGGLSNSPKNRIKLINEIKRIQKENNVKLTWRQSFWLNAKGVYFKLRFIFKL